MKIMLVNPPNAGRSIPEEEYGITSIRHHRPRVEVTARHRGTRHHLDPGQPSGRDEARTP